MRAVVQGVFLGIAALIIVGAWASPAMAGFPAVVPEIDGTSVATGLGALSAGVLILRSYFNKR